MHLPLTSTPGTFQLAVVRSNGRLYTHMGM